MIAKYFVSICHLMLLKVGPFVYYEEPKLSPAQVESYLILANR